MENRVGVVMGTKVVFRSRMRIRGWMPRTLAGIVSPKRLNSDDSRTGDQCSVQGPSGHSGCLKDRQDDLEVLEGSPTWVWCLLGLGVRQTGSHSIVGSWDWSGLT